MTILVITDLYPKDVNHSVKETSWAIHELIKGLHKYDIKVKQVLRPSQRILWRKLRINKNDFSTTIDNILVETKTFLNIPKNGFYFTNNDLKYLNKILDRVDLVVAHMSSGASVAKKIYKNFNIPFIYVLHNSDLLSLNKQKDILSCAQNIYSRSWALNKQLARKNINSKGVVFSGIEKSLIVQSRNHDFKKIKIISVNLLQKLKNIDVTIKALSYLKEYNWQYRIIGDGEEYKYLQKLVKELNLNDRISFLGFQSREYCIKEMRKSDIFVMPSAPETFGLAYLEAMASNCFVIGSIGWGVDGLIKHKQNGYLVTPRNVEDLKNIFLYIFNNDQSEIYQNSLKTIKNFTLEDAQKNYAQIIHSNITNKQKYREFCKQEKNIPIFSKDWWLDSVCGKDDWDVVLVEKGGQISASLPYIKTKKAIFDLISMPKLTQTLGIFIKYPKGQKYYKRLSWEKDMMSKLEEQLPKFDYFSQNFHRTITNWLPFYWKGFEQTTRYTYVIENITIEELEKNLETDIRRRRRKAYANGVAVIESSDMKKFYELNTMTFKRQSIKIPYTFDFVEKLYKTCKENDAVKMYFAKYENKIIAVNFLVYDNNTVYYLMGGIHPDFKNLGGMDIVQFESIKFALESGRAFDFEGSMIESIEKYFRSFGAIQKPYFNTHKTNSKLLELAKCLKEVIR